MTRMTLSGEIGRQLIGARDCVELCDEVGRTIGFFTPVVAGAVRGPQVDDAELARRDRDDDTLSTDEVLGQLRTR